MLVDSVFWWLFVWYIQLPLMGLRAQNYSGADGSNAEHGGGVLTGSSPVAENTTGCRTVLNRGQKVTILAAA